MAQKLDVEFVNPFIDATIQTLKIQCSLTATAGKPYLKPENDPSKTDIAGIIGLSSAAFNGSIALCFPKSVFLAIMGAMLGERYLEISRELEDGAGELLNIIFGTAKTVLNKNGYAIDKALPTIIRGNSIVVRHVTKRPTITLPFTLESGTFRIEIAIDQ